MNIAPATRKTLVAAIVVPVVALTALSAESFAGLSGAHAQQTAGIGTNGGGSNEGSENPVLPMMGNCIPGTAKCRPPRKIVRAGIEDCSCEVNYRLVNGRRVAVKDCYVEIGEIMRYCRRDAIMAN